MKKLFLIPLLFFSISTYTQTSNNTDSQHFISSEVVDVVPLLSECDKLTTKETKRTCMNTQLEKHVKKHFNYSIIHTLQREVTIQNKKNKGNKNYRPLLRSGAYSILIEFIVDKQGSATDITVKAIHPKLKKEGQRIVKLLPQMKPARQHRKLVNVQYKLPPISFTIK